MIVSTKELFEHAYGKYAVGAYNINNAEQIMGLFRGNMDSKAPFIVQLSKGARAYTDKRLLEAMIRAADEIFPDAIFAVHLDHGDEETCMDCIESGFYSSVMIDASHEDVRREHRHHQARRRRRPRQGHRRRSRTRPARRRGRARRRRRSRRQADRPEAGRGVRRSAPAATAWPAPSAPATAPSSSRGGQGLHFEVIEEIAKLLPGFPLVMHGSSSVPQDEVERINAAGGELKGAKGVDEAQISQGRRDGRDQGQHRHRRPPGLVPRAPRERSATIPENFDLRPPGKIFMAEYAKYIAHKNEVLGSAGQARRRARAHATAKRARYATITGAEPSTRRLRSDAIKERDTMAEKNMIMIDGNTAAATVAHARQRSLRDLPDHPLLPHGRDGRRAERRRRAEHLGHHPRRRRNAVRRRRRRRRARRADLRRADARPSRPRRACC